MNSANNCSDENGYIVEIAKISTVNQMHLLLEIEFRELEMKYRSDPFFYQILELNDLLWLMRQLNVNVTKIKSFDVFSEIFQSLCDEK